MPVALFSDLTPASVADLLDHASVRSYDRDSLLFSAADPADRFFVVVAGAVKLSVLDADGNETIIEIIGAGNSFAEAAMFVNERRLNHLELWFTCSLRLRARS